MQEKTAVDGETCLFLKGKFADGFLLAFWSHSPCGCVRDQEQGYALIDCDTQEIINQCETVTIGMPAGEDFRSWLKEQKEEHGKLKYFTDGHGRHIWKITDC